MTILELYISHCACARSRPKFPKLEVDQNFQSSRRCNWASGRLPNNASIMVTCARVHTSPTSSEVMLTGARVQGAQTTPVIKARGTNSTCSRFRGTILLLLSCLDLAASSNYTTASPTVSGGSASPTKQTIVDHVVYNQWDTTGCGAGTVGAPCGSPRASQLVVLPVPLAISFAACTADRVLLTVVLTVWC